MESPVAPHGANDVSYATRINHEGNDSWGTLLVCYAIQCFRMGCVTLLTKNSLKSTDVTGPTQARAAKANIGHYLLTCK